MAIDDHKGLYVVIFAPQGIYHSSLRTFLQTIPGVTLVSSQSSLDAVPFLWDGNRSGLWILDADLLEPGSQDLSAVIGQLRGAGCLRCVVLANTFPQVRQALAAGANQALLKGLLDEPLRRYVMELAA